MKNKNEIIAIHPGFYISELIESLEITQEEFALRLGTTPKTISKLVNEEVRLSGDMALKLSSFLNSSPEVWLNLQKAYDVQMLKIKEQEQLEKQVDLIKQVDYNYFTQLGFLPETNDIYERIKYLCSFLSVSSLDILLEGNYNISYRKGIKKENVKNILNANIWVETVTRVAREVTVKPFNPNEFDKAIYEILELTNRPFSEAIDIAKEKLANCGVVLVLMPYLKWSGLHGFVKWIDKKKVVIAISDRLKNNDTFWFTFFHEVKHVQQRNLKLINYTWHDSEPDAKQDEIEADEFARSILIPQDELTKFVSKCNKRVTAEEIVRFASTINRHPGIVVGRLQYDKVISYKTSLNRLKTSIEF